MTTPRSERASKVVDAMLGISLLTQGLAEVGQVNGSRPMIVVAIIGGVFILAGTMFRRRLETRFQHFDATVSLIEGVVSAFVGAAAARRGTSYIQYAWFVAGVAFVGAAVIKLRKPHRTLSPLRQPAAAAEQAGDGQ